jgi:hypothetical protein
VWEAEESPLLEAVARERLMKTAGWERLSGCCVICKLWILAIALKLIAFSSGVYKWSINPISKQNPLY